MSTTVTYEGSTIATVNNNTKTLQTAGKYLTDDITLADVSQSGGITPSGTKSITSNGTGIDVASYAYADVTVPNSYAAGDEGKVVSNGALVAQTSDSVTTNGTVDTTLINSLTVNVSGGGGNSGYTFDWASSAQVVTIGTNSVTNMQGVKGYFDSYSYDKVILLSPLTVNNQLVALGTKGGTPTRWRNGSIVSTVIGAAYDARLVEGTQYLLLKA